jgi:acyl carrier protein
MNSSDQSQSLGVQPDQLGRQQILERLECILRRDLKLGADSPICSDTPLLGGDHDLDSLDILMLLTSVEKEFDIKIPNDEIRRDAFTNVGSLAGYIDERRR